MLAKRLTRLGLATALAACFALPVHAADEAGRRVKTKIQAVYPELARRMNLAGTVRLEVVVGENGATKTVKPIGGNPVLIQAATDAVKRWKWEAGSETTETVEFHFQNQ